jgi:two-component system sensor histidine kinase YesM
MFKGLFGKRSILKRLILSYAIFILLPTIIIGTISLTTFESSMKLHLSETHLSEIKQLKYNLETLIGKIITLVSVYNENDEIKEMVTERPDSIQKRVRNIYETENKMKSISLALRPMDYEVNLLGGNGIVYHIDTAGTSKPGLTLGNKSIHEYEWYERLIRHPENILWLDTQTVELESGFRTNRFYAAKALYGRFVGNFKGVLLLGIDERNIWSIYSQDHNQDYEFLIVNQKGRIISGSNREKVGKNVADGLYSQLDFSHGNSSVITFNSEEYLCIFEKFDEIDWYIVKAIPLNVLFKEIDNLKEKIIIICIICILISIFPAVLIARKISNPLIKLSRRIKTLSGRKEKLKRVTFSEEMDVITGEYDHMILQLEEVVKELWEEQEKKKQLEMEALQMQIKPHFLYNTLNSLKCLVWTNKINLIEPTINSLIKLLRYTANMSEFITVKEEIELVKHYVFIHQIRMDKQIDFNFWLEKSVEDFGIPKLLLQPIVENAIFHGLEPKNGKGRISVLCKKRDQKLIVSIFDDGVGMDEAELGSLMSGKMESDQISFNGIGVKNVFERLKLYYGAESDLRVESRKGFATVVTIIIPIGDKVRRTTHA